MYLFDVRCRKFRNEDIRRSSEVEPYVSGVVMI